MLTLHTIKPARGAKKHRKTIGRGGKRGTYSGKGMKGQRARSGVSGLKRLGMRQLMERTPKLRGFKSRQIKPEVLNLSVLSDKFSATSKEMIKINPEDLFKQGLISTVKKGVKILGDGEVKIKLEISGCAVSQTAKEKIEKAGGKVIG